MSLCIQSEGLYPETQNYCKFTVSQRPASNTQVEKRFSSSNREEVIRI